MRTSRNDFQAYPRFIWSQSVSCRYGNNRRYSTTWRQASLLEYIPTFYYTDDRHYHLWSHPPAWITSLALPDSSSTPEFSRRVYLQAASRWLKWSLLLLLQIPLHV